MAPSVLPWPPARDDHRAGRQDGGQSHLRPALRQDSLVAISLGQAQPVQAVPMRDRFGWHMEEKMALELGPRRLHPIEDDEELARAPQIKELASDLAGLVRVVTRGHV